MSDDIGHPINQINPLIIASSLLLKSHANQKHGIKCAQNEIMNPNIDTCRIPYNQSFELKQSKLHINTTFLSQQLPKDTECPCSSTMKTLNCFLSIP